MTTLTVQLDDRLAEKTIKAAAEQGVTVDAVISKALERVADPTPVLSDFIRRARAENRRFDGTFLTDEEMYGR